jgi:cyclopropane fatty-acyl-phospholipid synthase-like methyltransferase
MRRVTKAIDRSLDTIDCSATTVNWQLHPANFGRLLSDDDLREVGIKRGMHVLDLGCGTGDASLLIAKLVGPSGLVAGVDRSAEAIDLAQRRATVDGNCYWARFIVADPDTFSPPAPVDVVIVRVEQLQRSRIAATFSRFISHLRAGGIIVLLAGERAGGQS